MKCQTITFGFHNVICRPSRKVQFVNFSSLSKCDINFFDVFLKQNKTCGMIASEVRMWQYQHIREHLMQELLIIIVLATTKDNVQLSGTVNEVKLLKDF